MKVLRSKLIKSKTDIAKLKKANQISSGLHTYIQSKVVAGKTEIQVNQIMKNYFNKSNASGWAYANIVGSGHRSTILHAKPTHRRIKESDLLLIDVGVKYQNWCADITRTFPAGNKFSTEQKLIYAIVLKVQKRLIRMVKPGITLQRLHIECIHLLEKALFAKKIIKKGEIKKVFPHKTSHWIGLKVHDECPYVDGNGNPIKLQKGMVFTIEPGLYFKNINPQFDGIGIRIEDVVVVTDQGCEVLSSAPKEIAEIEKWRKKSEDLVRGF